jgi:hypothetical protein
MKELLAGHERRYISKWRRKSKKIKSENGGFLIWSGKKPGYIVVSTPASADREFLIEKNLSRSDKTGMDVYEYRFGQDI